MGIFEKFKIGFKRSASNIASGLKEIIVKKEIDEEVEKYITTHGTEVKDSKADEE